METFGITTRSYKEVRVQCRRRNSQPCTVGSEEQQAICRASAPDHVGFDLVGISVDIMASQKNYKPSAGRWAQFRPGFDWW
jgi:hypothetical protein